jgi:hypothetical protein
MRRQSVLPCYLTNTFAAKTEQQPHLAVRHFRVFLIERKDSVVGHYR